jgi:hypothetical protein
MAIRINTRGIKRAIGTESNFVNKCGNAPSVKKAANSEMRGRNKLSTRNQIGNVVFILFKLNPNLIQKGYKKSTTKASSFYIGDFGPGADGT